MAKKPKSMNFLKETFPQFRISLLLLKFALFIVKIFTVLLGMNIMQYIVHLSSNVEVRSLQGNVKKVINFADVEGVPTSLNVWGDAFVVVCNICV